MLLLISDANVLIDIEKGGLLASLFHLNMQFAVPDILFKEELGQRHAHLIEYGLQVRSVSSRSIAKTVQFAGKYSKVSRNNLFALALALQDNCSLLTGDKFLSTAAEKEGVTVRKTMWLMNAMTG